MTVWAVVNYLGQLIALFSTEQHATDFVSRYNGDDCYSVEARTVDYYVGFYD